MRVMVLDEIDMSLLELLLEDGRMTFKDLGKRLGIDERLAARRVARLEREGVIMGYTASIDWSRLGFTAEVWVGTRTGVGKELKDRFFEFMQKNPNIVEVKSTVGTYEYIFHAICEDLHEYRLRVGTPLEPLTAGLSASITTETVKALDVKQLIRSRLRKMPVKKA